MLTSDTPITEKKVLVSRSAARVRKLLTMVASLGIIMEHRNRQKMGVDS